MFLYWIRISILNVPCFLFIKNVRRVVPLSSFCKRKDTESAALTLMFIFLEAFCCSFSACGRGAWGEWEAASGSGLLRGGASVTHVGAWNEQSVQHHVLYGIKAPSDLGYFFQPGPPKPGSAMGTVKMGSQPSSQDESWSLHVSISWFIRWQWGFFWSGKLDVEVGERN